MIQTDPGPRPLGSDPGSIFGIHAHVWLQPPLSVIRLGSLEKADIYGVGSAYLVHRSSIWPPAGRACAARTGRWTARTWPWCACAERRSRERAPSARNSRWSVDGQRTPHINTRGGRSADQVRYPATPLLADSLNGSGIPKAVFHEQKRCAIEVADAKKN